MSVRKADNPELFENVQEKNLLRQYDLLLNCVEIGLEKGIESFDKYMLWALTRLRWPTSHSLADAFARSRSMSATTFRRTTKKCRS